jgi:hypothetical protein
MVQQQGDGPGEPRGIPPERPILDVVLPEASREHVRRGNVEKSLDPTNFPEVKPQVMRQVTDLTSRLSHTQRSMLLVGLTHALNDGHRGSVRFALQECGYALEGVGLELRDETVTERRRRAEPAAATGGVSPDADDDGRRPLTVIFAVEYAAEG